MEKALKKMHASEKEGREGREEVAMLRRERERGEREKARLQAEVATLSSRVGADAVGEGGEGKEGGESKEKGEGEGKRRELEAVTQETRINQLQGVIVSLQTELRGVEVRARQAEEEVQRGREEKEGQVQALALVEGELAHARRLLRAAEESNATLLHRLTLPTPDEGGTGGDEGEGAAAGVIGWVWGGELLHIGTRGGGVRDGGG